MSTLRFLLKPSGPRWSQGASLRFWDTPGPVPTSSITLNYAREITNGLLTDQMTWVTTGQHSTNKLQFWPETPNHHFERETTVY